MMICKRPVPPDNHLQEAGPSGWSFARGQPLRMIICKRQAPADDQKQQQQKQEKEREKEKEKEKGKEFLRADGRMDQPKVVQEVLADLKKLQNWYCTTSLTHSICIQKVQAVGSLWVVFKWRWFSWQHLPGRSVPLAQGVCASKPNYNVSDTAVINLPPLFFIWKTNLATKIKSLRFSLTIEDQNNLTKKNKCFSVQHPFLCVF